MPSYLPTSGLLRLRKSPIPTPFTNNYDNNNQTERKKNRKAPRQSQPKSPLMFSFNPQLLLTRLFIIPRETEKGRKQHKNSTGEPSLTYTHTHTRVCGVKEMYLKHESMWNDIQNSDGLALLLEFFSLFTFHLLPSWTLVSPSVPLTSYSLAALTLYDIMTS